MIKAVIFDLDNTLIDFSKYTRFCTAKAVSAMIKVGLKSASLGKNTHFLDI